MPANFEISIEYFTGVAVAVLGAFSGILKWTFDKFSKLLENYEERIRTLENKVAYRDETEDRIRFLEINQVSRAEFDGAMQSLRSELTHGFDNITQRLDKLLTK
jgi:hypothetical protein